VTEWVTVAGVGEVVGSHCNDDRVCGITPLPRDRNTSGVQLPAHEHGSELIQCVGQVYD
jgi:hypothetical protein